MSLDKSSTFPQFSLAADKSASSYIYEFDGYRLDSARLMLYRNGEVVGLKPKVIETLVALVEQRGEVIGKNELMDRLWVGCVVEEANLQQNIYLLRKTLGKMPNGQAYIDTFWRRGYRFNGEVVEVMAHQRAGRTLTQAAFEPAESLSPDLHAPIFHINVQKRRWSAVTVGFAIAVLFIGAAAITYWFNLRKASERPNISSIAVMPFVNETRNSECEYLVKGLTGTVIKRLSRIEELKVKAQSSVSQYAGRDYPPQLLGEELGVQAIVNGRLTQSGDTFILSWEVIKTADGQHLDVGQLVTKLSDLAEYQGEIATRISTSLRTEISETEKKKLLKKYTDNAEAYQLYLKGKYYFNERSIKSFALAAKYYQQAVALDPTFALAYAEFAHVYTHMAVFGLIPYSEAMPKATEAVMKSLSLDPDLTEAHQTYAFILRVRHPIDFALAERENLLAIELDPNSAWSHNGYGVMLTQLERHDEALEEFRRTLEIEPLSLIYNRNYGWALMCARKYEEAIEQFRKTSALDPYFERTPPMLAEAYELAGRYRESAAEQAHYYELIDKLENAAFVRRAFAAGDRKIFLRIMTGPGRPTFIGPYKRAQYLVELEQFDSALAELEKAFAQHEYDLSNLKTSPFFDKLRGDSRFESLLRRVGFP